MSKELHINQSCITWLIYSMHWEYLLLNSDLRVKTILHFISVINLSFCIVLLLEIFSQFQVTLGFLCVLICGLEIKKFKSLSYFIAQSFMKEILFSWRNLGTSNPACVFWQQRQGKYSSLCSLYKIYFVVGKPWYSEFSHLIYNLSANCYQAYIHDPSVKSV